MVKNVSWAQFLYIYIKYILLIYNWRLIMENNTVNKPNITYKHK